ncbi:MAG: hypothetical protein QOJ25_2973 [Solirubrobacteraceae bacterium]|jgi:MFS family permease|nr:hypothetical protein [Solirubrobacteraceae bacterium]
MIAPFGRVLAGYGLTFATTMITAGRLGDEHGHRRMFTFGLALAPRLVPQIARPAPPPHPGHSLLSTRP